MNYYQEILAKIKVAIEEKDYDLASKLIEDELSAPYIPKDVLESINELKTRLPYKDTNNSLSDDKILEFLKSSPEKQLVAIEELNKRNLRDYLDVCNEYLLSDGFKNAKVLLIYSLIEQEISEEISYKNDGIDYSFIPKFCLLPDESLGYKKAKKILEDKYMKDPSLLEMAKSLLNKECLLTLPLSLEEDEAENIANKIVDYITKAFEA